MNIQAYLSGSTDKPRYQQIYPGWLIDQHTWLSIWVDYTTNVSAYLSGLTKRPTYLTIYVYWQTSIPTLTNLPTNKPIYVDWLTGLSIQVKWLTIILGWQYDYHTSLSIPDYLSGVTVQPLNQTIYPGWLYDHHTSLSIPDYLSGLTVQPLMDGWVRVLHPFNSISVISRRWKGEHERLCAMKRRLGSGRISPPAGFEPATPWSEVGSANRSATRTLLYNHWTRLSIKVDCTTNIPDYISRLTVRPTFLIIYPGWLYDQHSWLYIQVDCTTNIPDYISRLTVRPTSLIIYPG